MQSPVCGQLSPVYSEQWMPTQGWMRKVFIVVNTHGEFEEQEEAGEPPDRSVGPTAAKAEREDGGRGSAMQPMRFEEALTRSMTPGCSLGNCKLGRTGWFRSRLLCH